jgi:hypothetical protein
MGTAMPFCQVIKICPAKEWVSRAGRYPMPLKREVGKGGANFSIQKGFDKASILI